MFRQQYKIVVLKYCCRFIQNSSKHFCIYCYLPLACFCITPFGTCSSPCIKFYRLCSGLYFCFFLQAIHITFPSLQYSALQCSFCTVIRLLVPFHVHIFCLDFFVSSYFEFLVQSFRKLYYMGCQLSVIVKCIKHMLACKFYFIFYFTYHLNHAILIIAICYCQQTFLLVQDIVTTSHAATSMYLLPYQWYQWMSDFRAVCWEREGISVWVEVIT